jgi:helicase MOV-10
LISISTCAATGWDGLETLDSDFPVLFHGIVGRDEREGNSPSWFNPDEALAVWRHIESLMVERRRLT